MKYIKKQKKLGVTRVISGSMWFPPWVHRLDLAYQCKMQMNQRAKLRYVRRWYDQNIWIQFFTKALHNPFQPGLIMGCTCRLIHLKSAFDCTESFRYDLSL